MIDTMTQPNKSPQPTPVAVFRTGSGEVMAGSPFAAWLSFLR